jgi:gliding motility-associated-like protein
MKIKILLSVLRFFLPGKQYNQQDFRFGKFRFLKTITYLSLTSFLSFVFGSSQSLGQCSSAPSKETVVNGNFSDGALNGTVKLQPGYNVAYTGSIPGTYLIDDDANKFNPDFTHLKDHTSGTGKFLMIDAINLKGTISWTSEVTIEKNQVYYFSAWIISLIDKNNALLDFEIKGEHDANFTKLGGKEAGLSWSQIYTTWNSGNNTKATIQIIDNRDNSKGDAGNDFGIDDISFINSCQNIVGSGTGVKPNLVQSGTLCGGGKVTLDSQVPGADTYVWTQTAPTVKSIQGNTDKIDVTSPGTYSVCVTKGTNCPNSSSIEVKLTCPVFDVKVNDDVICYGKSATLTATISNAVVGKNYRFEWTGKGALDKLATSTTLTDTYTPNPTDNTTYNIKVTELGTTPVKSFDANAKVTVLKPSLNPITPKCVGDGSVPLSGIPASPGSFTFSGPGVSGSNFSPVSAGIGTHTITGIYSEGVGKQCTATTKVIVNAKPDITVIPKNASCTDGDGRLVITISPTPAPGSIYSASYDAPTGPVPAKPYPVSGTDIVIPKLFAGNYTNIIVRPADCPSNAATAVIIKEATSTPDISITPIAPTVCEGTSVTFNAIDPVNPGNNPDYKWFRNNTVVLGETGTSYTPAALQHDEEIYVEMTSKSSCITGTGIVKSEKAKVTIIKVSLDADALKNLCADGKKIPLTGGSGTPAGGNYQYRGTDINSATGELTTKQGIHTIYYDYTVNDSTCTAEQTIDLKPVPVFTLSKTDPSCPGKNGKLLFSDLNSGATYQIRYSYKNTSGNVTIYDQPHIAVGGLIEILNLDEGDYTKVTAELSGCISEEQSEHLNDLNSPNPSVSMSPYPILSLCVGDSAKFTATPQGQDGIDYKNPVFYWYINSSQVMSGSNPYAGATYVSASLKNNDVVKVSMDPGVSCTNIQETQAVVYVIPKPVPVITGGGPICAGSSVILSTSTSTVTTSSTYQWYLNAEKLPGIQAEQKEYKATETGIYKVEITNNFTCTANDDTTVNVVTMDVNAGPDKNLLLDEDKEFLTLQLEGNAGPTPSGPYWTLTSLPDTLHIQQTLNVQNQLHLLNPVVQLPKGTHWFMLTDTNGICRDSSLVRFIIKPRIWIPTAISPNGDEANEKWYIKGLEDYDEYTINVYNRYGSKVHQQKFPYLPWDGRRNGEPMPVGTYYFVVEVPTLGNYSGTLVIYR